jgi:hypothetical protein
MGSRLVLEGLRQAGEGFESFGQGLQRSRERDAQLEALRKQEAAKSEADQIRQDLFSQQREIETTFQGPDGEEEDITGLASTTVADLGSLAASPNTTREEFNAKAGEFLSEAMATGDPVTINSARQLVSQYQDSINARDEARQKEADNLAKVKAAQASAGAKIEVAKLKADEKPNKGQDALDTEFAKSYQTFKTSGGYKGALQDIALLRETADRLESDDSLTGPAIGLVPEKVLAATNPGALDVRDNTNSVVQKSFRSVLGGVFTQQEGENIKKTAFNNSLPGATNAKRLRAYADMLEAAAESKALAGEYFDKNNGTLQGYAGPKDFRQVVEAAKTKRTAKPGGRKEVVIDLDQFNKLAEANDAKMDEHFAKIDAQRAAKGQAPLNDDEKANIFKGILEKQGIRIQP